MDRDLDLVHPEPQTPASYLDDTTAPIELIPMSTGELSIIEQTVRITKNNTENPLVKSPQVRLQQSVVSTQDTGLRPRRRLRLSIRAVRALLIAAACVVGAVFFYVLGAATTALLYNMVW